MWFNARDIKHILMPRNTVFGFFFVLVCKFSYTLKYVCARFFVL